MGLEYVLRSGTNISLFWRGEKFSFGDIADFMHASEMFDTPGVLFTEEKYGPLTAIAWWRGGCKEPIYLVTNMESARRGLYALQKEIHEEDID